MRDPLCFEVLVRCSPAHAYDAFTGRIDTWWPRSHRRFADGTLTLEAREGGLFVAESLDGERFEMGRVLACDPPHALRFTWTPGAISAPTMVDVTFEADGASTRVRVTHREADAALGDAWPKRATLFARGWTSVLDALATYIATHAVPRPDQT